MMILTRRELGCLIIGFIASAQAQTLSPATPTATEFNPLLVGAVLLAIVIVGTFFYLKRKNPVLLTSIETKAKDAETALFHKHIADANANAAAANANAAAALAKVPVAAPAAPVIVTAVTNNAIIPADPSGTIIAPAPTTGVSMPNQPYSVAPTNPSRDINIEGPAIVRWLNGAQEDVNGVPLNPPTPPAHPEVPDAFSRYWTTMEALWPAHPEWGTGPASWELAYQAAVKVAGAASSTPRVSLPLPTSGPDLLVVTHYNLQGSIQSKARFYSDNQAILGRYMFNLDGINQVMLLLSRNTGGLMSAVYDAATNTYVMPDGRTLDQWTIADLGLDK